MEARRKLAVLRTLEGYSTREVADFLGVDPSTVRRWVAAFRDRGEAGLAAQPAPGRPRKLTSTQEKIALRWLTESPSVHGFETELWTAPRLGRLIREEFGVRLRVCPICMVKPPLGMRTRHRSPTAQAGSASTGSSPA